MFVEKIRMIYFRWREKLLRNQAPHAIVWSARSCHVRETDNPHKCSLFQGRGEIYVKRWSQVQIEAFFRCKINLGSVRNSDRVTKLDKTFTCIMSGPERRACQRGQGWSPAQHARPDIHSSDFVWKGLQKVAFFDKFCGKKKKRKKERKEKQIQIFFKTT